jgi:predicted molibdopterin-dependent oxidoreductase YjgC
MDKSEPFTICHDGKPLPARSGQSIAEALLENGVVTFRKTVNGEPRGPFCNMGVCFECRMVIDGRPNTRACMTPAAPGCRVRTQNDAAIEVPDDAG